MAGDAGRDRLVARVWFAVAIIAALLALETAIAVRRVGLTGPRPPLSAVQTALRIAIVVGAVRLLRWRRHVLDRATLLAAAAAAGSSAFYGFGMRGPTLSAFRLLMHLLAYVFATAAAWRLGRLARRRTHAR